MPDMMSEVLLYWLKLKFLNLHSEITPRQILKLDLGPMARNGSDPLRAFCYADDPAGSRY
jgi:hypothetical protein